MAEEEAGKDGVSKRVQEVSCLKYNRCCAFTLLAFLCKAGLLLSLFVSRSEQTDRLYIIS